MKKSTLVLAVLVMGAAIVAPSREADGGTLSLRELQKTADKMFEYLGIAGRTSSIAARAFNIGRALSNAWKISQGINEIVIPRDKFAENAYNQGYRDGKRDGNRLKTNPRQGWIDVCNRCFYYKFGREYGLCYDTGYATALRQCGLTPTK